MKIGVAKNQYTKSIVVPTIGDKPEPTPLPIPEPKPEISKVGGNVYTPPDKVKTTLTETNEKTESINEKATRNQPSQDEEMDFPSISMDFPSVTMEVPSSDETFLKGSSNKLENPYSVPTMPSLATTSIPSIEVPLLEDGKTGTQTSPSNTISEGVSTTSHLTNPNSGIHITITGNNNTVTITSPNPTGDSDLSNHLGSKLPSESEILGVSTLEGLETLTKPLNTLTDLIKAKKLILETENTLTKQSLR